MILVKIKTLILAKSAIKALEKTNKADVLLVLKMGV